MSFFDQRYYAVTKANMSRIGMWPEQSKYAQIIRRLTALALALTFVAPRLTRLNDIWEDTDSLIHDVPYVLTGATNIVVVLRLIQHFDEIKLSFEDMERHWEMFKNTSAVVVLDKYAERGRNTAVVYSSKFFSFVTMHNIDVNVSFLICALNLPVVMFIAVIFYCFLCLSPVLLDVVNPLNETRPKIYIFHTKYGVDQDKYYWFILAYECIVTIVAVAIVIALQTVYSTWAIHACALFEVVSFNLKLVTNKYSASKENSITCYNDRNYKKISNCIIVHKMAISFAELIDNICSGPFAMTLMCLSMMIVFTAIQALIYSKHRDILMQSAVYMIVQVFNLYIISAPGQELMNHSSKIHTNAYDLEWPDMSVKAQKLLIPIMIRSSKPCCFTARKVYVLSMESFGSTIRTVLSYFTVFAQMI